MFLCEKGTQLATPLLLQHATEDDFESFRDHIPTAIATAAITTEASGTALTAAAAIVNTATRQESTASGERRREQLRLVQLRLRSAAFELGDMARLLGEASVDGGEVGDQATATSGELEQEDVVAIAIVASLLLASAGAAWYMGAGWVSVAAFDEP